VVFLRRSQTYEALVRGKRRAEERAAHAACASMYACLHLIASLLQTYEALVRGKRRAEERASC
jgi:hypothetical protein